MTALLAILTLATAPAHAAIALDPAPLLGGDLLECVNPDKAQKSCLGIGQYTRLPDGKILSTDRILVSTNPPVVMRMETIVRFSGNSICSRMTERDLESLAFSWKGAKIEGDLEGYLRAEMVMRYSNMIDLDLCTTLFGSSSAIKVRFFVEGKPADDDGLTMIWVRTDEGYTVKP